MVLAFSFVNDHIMLSYFIMNKVIWGYQTFTSTKFLNSSFFDFVYNIENAVATV